MMPAADILLRTIPLSCSKRVPCTPTQRLAKAGARTGDGLRAGDIHNTGTATEIYWVTADDDARAEFEGLGSVRLSIEFWQRW